MTEKIKPTLDELQKNFRQGYTRPLSWRKNQLRALLKGMDEMKSELEDAVRKDLGRCQFFTEIGEVLGIQGYCHYFLEHMDDFSKDDYFDPPLLLAPNSNYIRWEPLGVALIFGSWNYPYYVNLKPLV